MGVKRVSHTIPYLDYVSSAEA